MYLSLALRQTACVKVEAEAFEFEDLDRQTYFYLACCLQVQKQICRQHAKVEDVPAKLEDIPITRLHHKS